MTRFGDLPDEMLTLVAEQLPLRDRKALALVSKRMQDITLPLVFGTFQPMSWDVEKLRTFLETLSLKVMRAYSRAELILHRDYGDATDATRYRLLRSALCQMALKYIAFTIDLPRLEPVHDAASHDECESTLAELLTVALAAEVSVSFIGAAAEAEPAAESISSRYATLARHLAILEKSGNPIICISMGPWTAPLGSNLPYTALAKHINRQRHPPQLHLAGAWCTAASAKLAGFQGLTHLSLRNHTSAVAWAAFSPLVTLCAATLQKLELSFEAEADVATTHIYPSHISLPQLRTLTVSYDEVYELPTSGWSLEDIAAYFPTLERIKVSVTEGNEEDLQELASLCEGGALRRYTVSIAINHVDISLHLDENAPAHLQVCAPFMDLSLRVGIHNYAGSSRPSGRWHTHLNFERLGCIKFWTVAAVDAVEARRQWEKAMSVLRDKSFPALRHIRLQCGTIQPAYFMELANILAPPAFPALGSVDFVPAPVLRESSTWSEYDLLCLGHLRDVCRDKRIALNLVYL